MLVLARRINEKIKIGNDIVITVVQTGKGIIRLGIDAPPHVRILRGELEDRMKTQQDVVSDVQPDQTAAPVEIASVA